MYGIDINPESINHSWQACEVEATHEWDLEETTNQPVPWENPHKRNSKQPRNEWNSP